MVMALIVVSSFPVTDLSRRLGQALATRAGEVDPAAGSSTGQGERRAGSRKVDDGGAGFIEHRGNAGQ